MKISRDDVGDLACHCERREAIQRGVGPRSAATGSPRRLAPRDDAGDMGHWHARAWHKPRWVLLRQPSLRG